MQMLKELKDDQDDNWDGMELDWFGLIWHMNIINL